MAEEPRDGSGRPYHIRLAKRDVGRVALLPGDPGRVPRIAAELEGSRRLSGNREFLAYGGRLGGEKVVVMSTGIGGPSTAIAVEELARLGVKVMIRVGTCGSIVPRVSVGSVVIADSAVRMEGTSMQYVGAGYPAAATPGVVIALRDSARASGRKHSVGITASTDSFYAGQGRASFGGYFPSEKKELVAELRAANVLCFEMEAATIFVLGRLFGLSTGAVFGVVANRATNRFKPGAGVDAAIDVALGAVRNLKKYDV